jgi:formate C-acetyltransferase
MQIDVRRKLLQEYRAQRESTNTPLVNPVGEASGRTWIPIPPELIEAGRQAHGVTGFVHMFSQMLDHSPVEVRRGELIVGDYYFLLPYEIFPLDPPLDLNPYVEAGALPVVPSGHSVINLPKGLELGWEGILELITANQAHFSAGSPEYQYLQGAQAVVGTIQTHIRRYAQRAEELGRAAGAPDEAQELLEIAERCFRLASQPPQTFHDALQWYFFFITFERATSSGMGSVRFDQVFYLYYQHDLQAGKLDALQAQLLLECVFMKVPLFCSVGGITPDGQDAVNDLSYVALAACDQAGGASNLAVRWNPANPLSFKSATVDLLSSHGSGVPSVVNDEVIIPSLLEFGFPLEQARDYCFAGCFWYVVPGKEFTYHDLAAVSGVRALLAALQETRDSSASSYEHLWQAYCRRLEMAIQALLGSYTVIDPWLAGHYPEMVTSLLMDGCIEKGRDFNNSGTDYSLMTVLYVGLANVADSLYALKKSVFDQRLASLEEISHALEDNFLNREKLRSMLRSFEKYGNDEDEVDQIAVQVARHFKQILQKYHNPKGFRLRPAFYSWHRHTFEGEAIGATPDGRSSGVPLAHGGNPAHTNAHAGATASILSMAKIGFNDTAGCPFHIHLHGQASPEFANVVDGLLTAGFKLGAPHIIINRVDSKILWDAIEHPEDYHDLVIRVTGYSAHFTSLERKYQEEIARRNSF